MLRAPSVVVLAALGLGACRFDSDGSDTGGGAWLPADGSESSGGSDSGDSSGSSTDAGTSSGGPPNPQGDDSGSTAGDEGDADDPCPRVRVVVSAGGELNVRPSPSTVPEPIGALPNDAIVDHIRDVQGEWILTTDVWFEITSDEFQVTGFVSSDYAECTTDEV